MDGSRFDAIIRVLGTKGSRRGAAGLLAGLALPRSAGAASCKKATDCGNCRICKKGKCAKAADGARCADGTCRKGKCVCVPDCQGKTCGEDGCGRDCGKCGANERCMKGSCRCNNGFSSCGKSCADLMNDQRNCGACGVACGTGLVCCKGVCADPLTDVRNCGGCGQACPLNEQCAAGACVCGGFSATVAPDTCCPGGGSSSCSDASTSANFILADTCGLVTSCPAGYTVCIGSQATPQVESDSCRACCPPGSSCDTALGLCRYA